MMAQRTFNPLLGIAAALGSLFVIATVLLGHGNQLALLFRYLLVAGFFAGLLFPKGTLIFWLVLCGYTDLLKRFMVVFGNVEYSDLYNVLGIPPMMIAGVTLAVVVGALMGRFQLRTSHWRLFLMACFLMLVSAALAAKEKGGTWSGLIAAIANDGTYTMLLFVLPVLFKDTDDVLRLTKLLLLAYVPVALYGVFQQLHGFQEFEVAYLKTGLTLEIKQLYASEVRPFSTLNSPTAFSVVCAMLCVVSIMLTLTPRREGGGWLLRRGLATFFVAIYFAGLVASTSRSAMLLVLIALVGFLCFRSGSATRWLYASCGAAFLALVLMADTILSNLDVMQDKISDILGDGQFITLLSRVGTFSDRLHGFANLITNPEVYTFFGYGPERGSDERDPLYSHDMISNMLVTHGVVPFLAFAIIGGVVLKKIHGHVLRLPDRHHRLLAAGLLSLAFSLFVLSAVSGSVLGTFPINALFWLCLAQLMLVYQSDALHSTDEEEMDVAEEVTTNGAPPAPPARVVHRFRRSGYSAPPSRL